MFDGVSISPGDCIRPGSQRRAGFRQRQLGHWGRRALGAELWVCYSWGFGPFVPPCWSSAWLVGESPEPRLLFSRMYHEQVRLAWIPKDLVWDPLHPTTACFLAIYPLQAKPDQSLQANIKPTLPRTAIRSISRTNQSMLLAKKSRARCTLVVKSALFTALEFRNEPGF